MACRALLQIARLRHEQSDALYEQILTQCTDEEVRGLAALMLGRRYRQAGRGEQARRVLESIVPTQPQYAYAQLELAQLHVEAGKADEAIELIARQVAQTPNAELTAQLGLLHQRRGEHEQALPLLREALPQLEGATAAAAQVGLGWSLYKTGQYEAAWTAWQAAWQAGCLGWRPAAHPVAGYERVCADLGGQPAHGTGLSGDGCKRGHSRRGLVGAGAVVFGSRGSGAGGRPSSALAGARRPRVAPAGPGVGGPG